METVSTFLENLQKDQGRRQHEFLEKQKLRKEELEKLKQTLSQIKDETNQCTTTIDKNLSSITSYKHSILKVVQEPREDAGLPISNVARNHAVNFFNDAMTFINTQSENSAETDAEKAIDTAKLSSTIQTSAENSQKEIVKIKNKVAAVETVVESLPVLSNYIASVEEKEEESPLDTSLTLI